MAVASRPERTGRIRALAGDPRAIDRSLREFRKVARVLSSNRPRLIDKYARKWVAIHEGRVRAQGDTIESVLAEVDRLGLPRDHIIVRYIDKTQRTMIL